MLLFLCIIVAAAVGIKKISFFPYKARPVFSVKVDHELVGLEILQGGKLATFDGDRLIFYRGSEKQKAVVDRMGEGQSVFFGEEDAMLYDKNTRKLTVFSPDGKQRQSYYLDGELFQAEVQGGVRIVHCRYEDGEKLFIASEGGNLKSVFETKHYILDYRFDSEKRFAVAELANTANGYKTTVYQDDGKADRTRMRSTEFPMEVAMSVVKTRYPVIATEKHLYGLDDELITQTTPIISDIAVHDGDAVTLHSGMLSIYDKNLREKKRRVMEANVDRLASMKGELFAYGNREILGDVDSNHPYYIRFKESQDALKLKEGYLVAYHHKKATLYQLKPHLTARRGVVQEIGGNEEESH